MKKSKQDTVSKGVKAKPEAAHGLSELFENQLKDIYWAEKALTKSMPKVIENASSPDLVEALSEHLQLTEEQVTRCEDIFEALESKPEAKECEAMKGLIKECEDVMELTVKGVVRDAGIIAAVQKIEHYEIASYGTLKSFASLLGEDEVVSLIEETLEQEKEADVLLTEIAEATINIEAMEFEEKESSSR